MPPTKKFDKETIVATAYTIVKNEGFGKVNARRIAKELGCSVQPIFHNFTSMEELNKAVYEKIYNKYKNVNSVAHALRNTSYNQYYTINIWINSNNYSFLLNICKSLMFKTIEITDF